ncbi:MAG: hypothetical protein U0U46_00055 [Saprospiraceae bacterium]
MQHAKNSTDEFWTVIYRKPNEFVTYSEVTTDVRATVSRLDAQGFIVVDIVDGA